MKRVIEEKDLIELLTCYYKYMALNSYGINNWIIIIYFAHT